MHKFFPYLWSLLNTGGSQAIGFFASLVIARAASPDDFGVLRAKELENKILEVGAEQIAGQAEVVGGPGYSYITGGKRKPKRASHKKKARAKKTQGCTQCGCKTDPALLRKVNEIGKDVKRLLKEQTKKNYW